MPFSSRTLLRAPSQPPTQAARIVWVAPSGELQLGCDPVGLLCDADQFGVPLDRQAKLAQPVAHDALVVVLAEDQDVGIGRHGTSGVAERHPRHLPPLRPHVGAGGDLAKFESAIGDAELWVDLQRARLHAERPGLLRWSGVAVDDAHAHASADQLVGQHQSGRAGPDHQDVRIHVDPSPPTGRQRRCPGQS